MKSMRIALLFGVLAGSSTAAVAMSLPPNQEHLRPKPEGSGLSEAEFDAAIAGVERIYRPVIEGMGKTLTVRTNWADNTVNAYASQSGNAWHVEVFGGLGRDPLMTADGLAFVVCHEFGHHLGGFPFYAALDWAAAEGQADYFAAQVCARRLWRDDVELNRTFRSQISGWGKEQCDAAWSTEADQDLCYRTAVASLSLAAITSRIYGTQAPAFDRRDERQVDQTSDYHPDGQCRLDTAIGGGSCIAAYDDALIPGKHQATGRNSAEAEAESALYTCLASAQYTIGLRSRCWFKPRL